MISILILTTSVVGIVGLNVLCVVIGDTCNMVKDYFKLSEDDEPDRDLLASTYYSQIQRAIEKGLVLDASNGTSKSKLGVISINGDVVSPEDLDYILNPPKMKELKKLMGFDDPMVDRIWQIEPIQPMRLGVIDIPE